MVRRGSVRLIGLVHDISVDDVDIMLVVGSDSDVIADSARIVLILCPGREELYRLRQRLCEYDRAAQGPYGLCIRKNELDLTCAGILDPRLVFEFPCVAETRKFIAALYLLLGDRIEVFLRR